MKALKNSIAGFLVSFIGSLPLGYLNLIGYGIYKHSGAFGLAGYLLGVVSVEAVVVYCSLVVAVRLTNNRVLIKVLECLAIFFLLFLAIWFFDSNGTESGIFTANYIRFSPFITGIILSSLNFSQLPFWTGWSVYLINGGCITPKSPLRFVYIFSTMVGTCCGMLLFVYFLGQLSVKAGAILHFIMNYGISLVFVLLSIYNAWLFYKKYYRVHKRKAFT